MQDCMHLHAFSTAADLIPAPVQVCQIVGGDCLSDLQINSDMMTELQQVKEAISPTDVLLAVDAMTGQEAAGVVKAFNNSAELTGKSSAFRRGPMWPLHQQVCLILHTCGGTSVMAIAMPSLFCQAGVTHTSQMYGQLAMLRQAGFSRRCAVGATTT